MGKKPCRVKLPFSRAPCTANCAYQKGIFKLKSIYVHMLCVNICVHMYKIIDMAKTEIFFSH